MKITIFGMAGTGTSSTGKLLAERLGYPFVSGGDMGRLTAKELGVSLNELEDLSKKDKKYDLLRDEHLKKFGMENEDAVIEARLGWYSVPDSIKIKLTCPDDVRLKRIADRENKDLAQVEAETVHREKAIKERFKEYYNMDFDRDTADDRFDLVLDTSLADLEGIVLGIINFLKVKGLEKEI